MAGRTVAILRKTMVASAATYAVVITSVHCFATEAMVGRPTPSTTITTTARYMTSNPAMPQLPPDMLPPPFPRQEVTRHATLAARDFPFIVQTANSMMISEPLLSERIAGISNPQAVPPLAKDAQIPLSKSLRSKLHVGPASDNLLASSPTTTSTPGAIATHRPRIVGHRGALYQELENTLPAFRACVGYCDAVELDVFELPKDKTLVVFHGSGHDDNPGLLHNYITNAPHGAKSILDLTYEQTQQLQFNPRYAEFGASASKIVKGRIPTLEQVLLELQPTGMEVKIELKGPGVARPVVELVDRLGMASQCSFSSFDHDAIGLVRQMRPQRDAITGQYLYRTGALFSDLPHDYLERAKSVGASEIHMRYDTCSKAVVHAIHQANMGTMAWMRGPVGMKRDVTDKYWDIRNEDERCYQALVDTGVQQLCVNRPDVLAQLLLRTGAMPATTTLPPILADLAAANDDLLNDDVGPANFFHAL